MEEKTPLIETQVEAPVETSVEQPQSKITAETVSPPKREKDPKRVAQGKRLAAISKEAKERKLRRKIEAEKLASQYFVYSNVQKDIFMLVSPAVVFLGLYILWKHRKTSENTATHLSPSRTTHVRSPSPPKPSTSNNNKNYSLFD